MTKKEIKEQLKLIKAGIKGLEKDYKASGCLEDLERELFLVENYLLD